MLLPSIDLEGQRPRTLVVECIVPDAKPVAMEDIDEIGTWSDWEDHVLAARYALAHFDGLNRFYLREEDQGLAARLKLPPNLYDGAAPNIEVDPRYRALREELERQRSRRLSTKIRRLGRRLRGRPTGR